MKRHFWPRCPTTVRAWWKCPCYAPSLRRPCSRYSSIKYRECYFPNCTRSQWIKLLSLVLCRAIAPIAPPNAPLIALLIVYRVVSTRNVFYAQLHWHASSLLDVPWSWLIWTNELRRYWIERKMCVERKWSLPTSKPSLHNSGSLSLCALVIMGLWHHSLASESRFVCCVLNFTDDVCVFSAARF